MVESLNPNIIVNATGSNPLLPPIKGLHENINKEGGKVSSITNMINHITEYPEDLTGKKVVVIGGGAVGLDVVEFFAPRHADVSIVEMMPVIGNGIDPVSKVGTFTMMAVSYTHLLTLGITVLIGLFVFIFIKQQTRPLSKLADKMRCV